MCPRIPSLSRVERDGIACWTDERLLREDGVLVAFTERSGGVSREPFASLNLAGHVGDEPRDVDANRERLLGALGMRGLRDRLVTAEQVHGDLVATVAEADAGTGAFVGRGSGPVPGVDALVTAVPDIPLMLLYADCVPVVLVALGERPAVAVVHAGWRGALARLPQQTMDALVEAGFRAEATYAYVGPHIGECCYEVDRELMSQFGKAFATIGRACARLDLAAAVAESLTDAGIPEERQCRLGMCTAHHTDAFYSYRAERRTGRHGAVAAIVKTDR